MKPSINLIPMQSDEYGIFSDTKNRVWASSLNIAEYFRKNHKNVLRDIEQLDCSPEFNRLNFEPINYKDGRGRMQKSYNMTRDGFVFLVMGYRGKEAAEIKEAYITRFNTYEKLVRKKMVARAKSIPPQHTFTDVIKACTPPQYLHSYTYSNFTNLAFKSALGLTARQLRLQRNIPDTSIIEDYLTHEELEAVTHAKGAISELLLEGTSYQGIKAALARR